MSEIMQINVPNFVYFAKIRNMAKNDFWKLELIHPKASYTRIYMIINDRNYLSQCYIFSILLNPKIDQNTAKKHFLDKKYKSMRKSSHTPNVIVRKMSEMIKVNVPNFQKLAQNTN